jgi:plasmid stabilization system protein ParE
MAWIELAPEVLQDFDRFFDHMAAFQVADAVERIEEIVQAVQVLANSPLIGRPVKGGKRELVIGTGARGYVALYRFVPAVDTVFVLAFRSQRESGFKRRR